MASKQIIVAFVIKWNFIFINKSIVIALHFFSKYGGLGLGQLTCSTEPCINCYFTSFTFVESDLNLSYLNFNQTFANWIRIAPVTVIARDRRGTNPCIAIRAIKSHRTPVPEVVSWSPAMCWVSKFATRCYGMQHKQINKLVTETVLFVWPRIANIA